MEARTFVILSAKLTLGAISLADAVKSNTLSGHDGAKALLHYMQEIQLTLLKEVEPKTYTALMRAIHEDAKEGCVGGIQ